MKPGLGSETVEQTVRFHTVPNIPHGLHGTLDEVLIKCPLIDIIYYIFTISLNLKIVKPGLVSGTMKQTVRIHTVTVPNIPHGL